MKLGQVYTTVLWQSQEPSLLCLTPKPAVWWRNGYFQWLPLQVAGCNSCPLQGFGSYENIFLSIMLGVFTTHSYPTFTPDSRTFTGINIQKPKSSLSKKTGDTQKLRSLDYLPIMPSSEEKIPNSLLQFQKTKGKNPKNYLL